MWQFCLIFKNISEWFGNPAKPVVPEWPEPLRTKDDPVARGREADALLANPLLQNAFETIKHVYRQQWENAPRGDIERQRIAHLSLAALKDVEGAIRVHIHNGQIADRKDKR